MRFTKVEKGLPQPHTTVLAMCTNGDIYQARVCYGMHEPFWCGHSTLNFGKILVQENLTVSHWAGLPEVQEIEE